MTMTARAGNAAGFDMRRLAMHTGHMNTLRAASSKARSSAALGRPQVPGRRSAFLRRTP